MYAIQMLDRDYPFEVFYKHNLNEICLDGSLSAAIVEMTCSSTIQPRALPSARTSVLCLVLHR